MKRFCTAELKARQRIARSVLALGLLALVSVLFAMPPASLQLAPCLFRSITGHSCMTCGMTRSLHAVSHGNLMAALGYHAFGPLVFVAMLLSIALLMAETIAGRKAQFRAGRKLRLWILVFTGASWLVYWCIRLILEFAA